MAPQDQPAANLDADKGAGVVLVGAGLMGSQIALEYAAGGHRVAVLARDTGRAWTRLRRAGQLATDVGLLAQDAVVRALESVTCCSDPVCLPIADLVVESLPEDLEIKATVLRPIAATMPSATIASNTSSLRIGELGDAIGAAERTLGTHYWNPPLLMPLVELVAGRRTGAARVDRVEQILEELGKRPVRVADVPGFAWNRLQFALLREAVWLVEHGVATPEDVDEIVRSGLARRWRLTGPFETASLGGAATFEAVAANLWPELSTAHSIETLAPFLYLGEDGARAKAVREARDRGLARDRLESEG